MKDYNYTELKEHIDVMGPRSVVIYIKELTAYVAAKAMIDTKYTKDSIDSDQKQGLYDAILGLHKLGRIFDKMDRS